MIYLTNAFSVTMVRWPQIGLSKSFQIARISAYSVGEILRTNDFVSCYGHRHSAWHLSRYLKVEIPVNRIPIHLKRNDTLIIAHAGFDRGYRYEQDGAPRWSFYMLKYLGEASHDDSR